MGIQELSDLIRRYDKDLCNTEKLHQKKQTVFDSTIATLNASINS